MSSPTIALALIVKNEMHNLPRLFASVNGCFDEIYVTDTGSTDGTVDWLKSDAQSVSGCPVHTRHFDWINSFSAARNKSFEDIKTDYVMWMDADDVMRNPDSFKMWKKTAMEFSEVFFVTYNYALDENKKPLISFVRERVFKTSLKPVWQYDIHEGIIVKPEWKRDAVPSSVWTVDHMRSAEDMKADKSRNVTILEKIKKEKGLDGRLSFYYGKELFEAQKPQEAIPAFDEALLKQDLEFHDKVLSFQYAAYSCMACADMLKDEFKEEKHKYLNRAASYALSGLSLVPSRAEFFVMIGDCFLRKGELQNAIPFYNAAKHCINPSEHGAMSPIYNFSDCYGENPSVQLAKIYFNIGRLDDAEREAKFAFDKFGNKDAKLVLDRVIEVRPLVALENNQEQTEDVVITCPPQTAYPFDEVLYQEKGMGGSETALIEMARWIKKKTNRAVKVFNMREETLVAPSGVEYIPNKELHTYLSKKRPKINIAWRHNVELTKAKTYLWCHDLVTPTAEIRQNFDKMICLTPFHKEYVAAKQGVPQDKIWTSRNGIVPEKLAVEKKEKNPNKLVWMSSPDRGLDRAMRVCDIVKQTFPDIELHVYYGLENLYKYGMADRAEMLKKMIDARPWVKYHGFTEQRKMYEMVSDAAVWVHPCDFIETFCITALEMLSLGIFPVTRRLGGLRDTLASAESMGMAVMLDHDCVTQDEHQKYASEVIKAISDKKWEKISIDQSKFSWESVADEWIKEMEL